MKQNIVKLVLVISCVLLFSPLCFAVTGAATKYEVKIAKLELYNSGTAQYVTVYTGTSSALDIASGTSGQSVGSFLSGLSVPDGTYTKCKVTPATTFTISGIVGAYHTTAATHDDDGGGRTLSLASNVGSEAACDVVVLASDIADVGTQENVFNTPITVTNGNPDHKVRVYFNVNSALVLTGPRGDGSFTIGPNSPSVTVSIENL